MVFVPVRYGGDGGSRTRVQKTVPATFYMIILSTEIPLLYRRQSGYTVRYLLFMAAPEKATAHVHRKNDALSVPTVKNGRTAA